MTLVETREKTPKRMQNTCYSSSRSSHERRLPSVLGRSAAVAVVAFMLVVNASSTDAMEAGNVQVDIRTWHGKISA